MIVKKFYAVCDVCSEEFGPFTSEADSHRNMVDWIEIQKNRTIVQAHSVNCARIALDNADDTFAPRKGKSPHFHDMTSVNMDKVFDMTGNSKGEYMEREYGGKHEEAESNGGS